MTDSRSSRPLYGTPLGKFRDDKGREHVVLAAEEWEKFFDAVSAPPAKATAVAGDTAPSVQGLGASGVLELANAVPTNVTTLEDAYELQEIVLLFTTANTTLVNSADFRLSGGVNVTPAANATLVMKYVEGVWRQVAPVITT